MAKLNIFEKLNNTFSYKKEMNRIEELIHAKGGVKLENIAPNNEIPAVSFFPFEEFIDKTVFKKWKGRGSCISCKDMRKELGIPGILSMDDPSASDFLTYLEYVANLFYLFKTTNLKLGYRQFETVVTVAAKENLTRNLELLGMDTIEFPDEEKVIIVEKSAPVAVTAVAVDSSLSNLMIFYNHYSVKGDIMAKREILRVLGKELELNRMQLAEINQQFTANFFYLLNNLDIKRNNRTKKDMHYKEIVAKMPPEELESWYDELYQMCIFAFLSLEQEEKYTRVKKLIDQIEYSC